MQNFICMKIICIISYRFNIFRIASRAGVGEAEVVFDFRSSFAFFEVDRFGDVHDRASVIDGHFRWFRDSVQGFTFAFNGFFHNAIEDIDVIGGVAQAVGGFDVRQNLIQDIQSLVLLLNVNLEHVQDTAFDVGRPWLIFAIENDIADL